VSDKDLLVNPKNVNFMDLLHICIKNFGNPRIRGSHHIFKTPWQGDPRINIQKDGNMAKPYQVKMVAAALVKLEERKNEVKENRESTTPKKGRKNKPGTSAGRKKRGSPPEGKDGKK
jgi:hypothetical protein